MHAYVIKAKYLRTQFVFVFLTHPFFLHEHYWVAAHTRKCGCKLWTVNDKTNTYYFKRLHLVKATSWQSRFLDLTILAPIWLCSYECIYPSIFFRFKQNKVLCLFFQGTFCKIAILEHKILSKKWPFSKWPKIDMPLKFYMITWKNKHKTLLSKGFFLAVR